MAHTDPHGSHGTPHGAPVGHETSDASLGGVEKFLIVIALFLAVAFGLMWVMYRQLQTREAAQDVRPSPVVERQGDRLPPLPRLQTLPVQDLATFRRAEDQALTSWTWVDRDRGIAQIPVERAIEILAERGLPVPTGQTPAVPDAAAATSNPVEGTTEAQAASPGSR